jgi:2,3-dihydroxybenzoate decarboxylase
MKIIALEEAFSMEGMKMVPKLSDATAPMSVDPVIMADWETRLADFTQWRLPEMDANGVALQVLSLTAPGIQAVTDPVVAVTDAKAANDYLAAVIAKHPDRFNGFAALPLQDPAAAAQELRRCVRELRLSGALVNDHTSGHYLDEPQFLPVWQALEELEVPLYIHPGAPPVDEWHLLSGYPYLTGPIWGWGAQAAGHALRLVFGGVFDCHPKARIILGHMGEFLPFQLWRLDSRYKMLRDRKLERLPSEYFGRNILITTSGVCSPAALAGAVMAVGEDAVLFSIDYPFESTEAAVRFLKSAPLSKVAREQIAGLNAARILRIG